MKIFGFGEESGDTVVRDINQEKISITFTGLRPGEKLYEELLMDEEDFRIRPNKLIHIGKPIEFDMEVFRKQLDRLYEVANMDSEAIRDAVREIVPTYQVSQVKRV